MCYLNVHQIKEAGTISNISVAENIFLGKTQNYRKGLFVNRPAMIREAEKALKNIGITDIDPALSTSRYDMQQRKLIEVAKVIYSHPQLLIIDETTTALSQVGREIVYRLMDKMADEGNSVLIISHDLTEVMEHCSHLTILRDGVIIDNLEKKDFEAEDIKFKMVGRDMSGHYYRDDNDSYNSEDLVLEAKNLTTMKDLMCFNLELHKGEILGIGGISDCGMHQVGRALYGLDDIVYGKVLLSKNGVEVRNAETAFKNGMGYVSKQRDTESLELNASIYSNIASTGYQKNAVGPFISFMKERNYVNKQIAALSIKCRNAYQPVSTLSGGNKQKVVFGKWCADDADVLILDCPTRGVDIGVKADMYSLIYEMKKKGKSIIMISEELPELMGMSDRILIMKDGKVAGEFFREDGFDDKSLLECMI